jgi:hypothetical protein
MNEVIGNYTAATTIDGSTHFLLIQPGSASTAYKSINRNVFLGVTGQPMDISTTQTVGNKVFSNTNSMTIKDSSLTIQNASDVTKQGNFSVAALSPSTTATYALPGASDTLVGTNATQTLLSKTLTGPVISGGSIDNTTVTIDAVRGHTIANTGSIYGVDITNGQISGANTILPAALATGIDYSKFYNPYKFSVYRASGWNLPASTPTKVSFDVAEYDTGSNYDLTTNYRFVAPINGFYKFDSRVKWSQTTADFCYIMLYKNGVNIKTGEFLVSPGPNSVGVLLSPPPIQLVVGDYIEVYVEQTTASITMAGVLGPSETYFGGFLVSAT